MQASVGDERDSSKVGMWQQGVSTRWEQAVEHSKLWQAKPLWIKFLIQVVYDVLPSPSNFAWTTFCGLLAIAEDWELKVDLWKQLKFQETIADMVLILEASKQGTRGRGQSKLS